jgi:hypothetical protein
MKKLFFLILLSISRAWFQWVKKKITMNSADYSVLKIKNSKGVMIDKSHFPVPEGPIWLQRLDPKNPKRTALIGP